MTSKSYASDLGVRVNLRRRRADMLAHAIFEVIRPHIHECEPIDYRAIKQALHGLLIQEGVEVLTDFDRQQLGLPPRGPDGWTDNEIVAMESIRLELMVRPFLDLPPLMPPHPAP